MSKKIIIIIVACISILSIFILGIFSPAVSQTLITVKVTGVEIDKSDCVKTGDEENNNLVVLLEGEQREYQLIWEVLPNGLTQKSSASNKNVSFVSSNSVATVSETGLVKFPDQIKQTISTIITITTEDGSYTDQITISYKYFNEVVID